MPRNGSGTYTLPSSAFIAGTTIKSADVNSDFSDIASALTGSLATDGQSTMSGPIKLAPGSAAAPSLTLASDLTTGWYNSAAGEMTYVSSGTPILALASTGGTITNLTVGNLTVTGSFSVAANRIVGEMVNYGGATAPALWLFCYGQAISRTTYSALFTALGTAFGAGDASTTFNVPDFRGRVAIGRDDMGGVAANRITAAISGITGTTLGSSGGFEGITLDTTMIPSHTHTGTTSTNGAHTHSYNRPAWNLAPSGGTGGGVLLGVSTADTTSSNGSHNHTFTSDPTGGGLVHNNTQPGLIVNKMIYAGV